MTRQFGVPGKLTCPVTRCGAVCGPKEIRRHINSKHPQVKLTSAQLASVDSLQCECGKVVSSTGKGAHKCFAAGDAQNSGSQRQRQASSNDTWASCEAARATGAARGSAGPSTAGPSEPPAPAGSSEGNNAQQTEGNSDLDAPGAPRLAAGPSVPRVNASCQIHYAGSTVPRKARTAFSDVTVETIRKVLSTAEGDRGEHIQAQHAFTLLPSQVLHATTGSKRRSSKVLGSIREYQAGIDVEGPPITGAWRRRLEKGIAQHVHQKLTRGNVSRAAKAFEASAVAEPTEQVLTQLEVLHPDADPPTVPPPPDVPPQCSRQQLKKILKTLPRGSAPGPSGWTFEHIQAVAQGSQEGMDAVLDLVNAVLSGSLPAWEALRASRLIPLRKGVDGVRPIAVGEVWLRLVAKCAMAVGQAVGESLAPLQLGVGVPGGAQCVGHAVAAGAKQHPGDVTLQIDCKNAFNTISRTSMLAAVAEQAPALLPLATWTYQEASPLLIPGVEHHRLWSRSGVRQGDPCGPLFFALTIQPVLQSLQDNHPSVRVVAYLDDIVLQGPATALAPAYQFLRDGLSTVGLVVQPRKSWLFSHDAEAAASLAASLGIPHSAEGMVVAGCPVGTQAFVANHAYTAAEEVAHLIDTLMGTDISAQDKLLLLRKSFQVKLAHLARCVEYDQLQAALSKAEAAVQGAFLGLIGRAAEDVDIDQLYLPRGLGGVGLQRLTAFDGVTCRAGFIAAAAQTQAALQGGSDSMSPFTGAAQVSLVQAWDQVCAFQGDNTVQLQDALRAGSLPGLQRAVSSLVTQRTQARLMQKYKDMLAVDISREQAEVNLARLHSLQSGVGTAWMDVLPTKETWELDDATVKSALRFQLGVSPGPPSHTFYRCACDYQGSDAHHAMTCDKLAGLRTLRHDHVQSSVQYGVKMAGHSSSIEPQERHLKDLRFGDDGYGMRGDVLVSTLEDCLNVDVVITHPASRTLRGRASRTPGAAARVAEENKRRSHAAGGTRGYRFVPFAIETYGRLGRAAVEVLGEWADAAAGSGAFDRDAYLTWVKRELSVTLVRGNARLFKKFVGVLTRGIGQRFVEGMDVPVLE